MKNKGIIINGGELNSTNLSVGENSKIQIGDVKPSSKHELPSETLTLITNLKQLIAQGDIKEVIQKLLLHFKDIRNKAALNAAIMHSSSITKLEMQENLNVISQEQAKIDRAKVTNAILLLIDDEIDK